MRIKTLKWIVPALLVFFLAPAAQALVSVDEIIRLHTAGLNQDALLLCFVEQSKGYPVLDTATGIEIFELRPQFSAIRISQFINADYRCATYQLEDIIDFLHKYFLLFNI